MKIIVAIFIYLIAILSAQDLTENEKYLLYKIEQLEKHFERNITDLDKKISHVEDNTNKSSNTCEKGWFSYLDQKCIKVIEKKGTQPQAIAECQSLGMQANLLSLHSEHEEQYLNDALSKYNNLADDVWIGLKFSEKAWKWTDKTELDYQNWDSDAKKDGVNPCVQLSITKSSLGKWKDESCDRQNLIVCQTKQKTVSVFADDLKNLTKVVNEQQNTIIQQKALTDKERVDFTAQINQQKTELAQTKNQLNQANNEISALKQNHIPVGFLYTHLPNQAAPAVLWPQYKWQDVTAQYGGLFFRAGGGSAAPFGQTQEASYSRITNINSVGLDIHQNNDMKNSKSYTIVEGKWSENLVPWDGLNQMSIFYSAVENKPRNTAVGIWKRIA